MNIFWTLNWIKSINGSTYMCRLFVFLCTSVFILWHVNARYTSCKKYIRLLECCIRIVGSEGTKASLFYMGNGWLQNDNLICYKIWQSNLCSFIWENYCWCRRNSRKNCRFWSRRVALILRYCSMYNMPVMMTRSYQYFIFL